MTGSCDPDQARVLHLQRIYNARDLGGLPVTPPPSVLPTPHPATTTRHHFRTRKGAIFRSATSTLATPDDIAALASTHHVLRIFDLRGSSADVNNPDLEAAFPTLPSDAASHHGQQASTTASPRGPGRQNFDIVSRSFSMKFLSTVGARHFPVIACLHVLRLSWAVVKNVAVVLGASEGQCAFLAEQRRHITARQHCTWIRAVKGFANMYYLMATVSREAVCEVLRECTRVLEQDGGADGVGGGAGGAEGGADDADGDADSGSCGADDATRGADESRRGAAWVHCTSGKDRTGMIAALLLTSVGVPRETIVEDYHLSHAFGLSETHRRSVLEYDEDEWPTPAMMEEFQELQMYFAAPAQSMRGFLEKLDRKFGSVEKYLDAIGFDLSWRTRLFNCFVEECATM